MEINLRRIVKTNARQYGMFIAFLVVILFFTVLTGGILLSPLNVTNIILQNSYVLIIAVGMLPLILIGKFDISVGSVMGFVGGVAAQLIVKSHMPFVPVLLISLGIGAVIGLWQGLWVAYIGVPAFVTTLSGMLIFRGLTIVVLDGRSIGPFSDTFKALSSSYLPDFFGAGRIHLTTLLIGILVCVFIFFNIFKTRKTNQKYGFDTMPFAFDLAKAIIISAGVLILTYFFVMYKGLPTVMILIAALIIIYSFITGNTVIGRRLYAQGGNEKAAQLSGIRTKLISVVTFVNLGVLAALGGLVFAARLNAGTPKAGTGVEMDAIAACFIGGASAAGGEGTIIGAIIGALIMGVINNGMSIMGISIDWQQAIKGLILLFAVAFDVYSKSRK
jgi:putative multiple sugar transport system permease protein